VRRFLAKARRTDQGFSATYRSLVIGQTPTTFVVVQQADDRGGQEWGYRSGNFVYIAKEGTKTLRFIQLDGRPYECLQARRRGPWSCEGPGRYFSNGIAMAIQGFDEPAELAGELGRPPSTPASTWSGTLNGRGVTCLRYGIYGSRTTWCITANGITVFVGSSDASSVEVVKLTASVPAVDFVLPAKPGRWHGFEYVSN
jgi:hypothetical protein